jgi:hypothetical protein
MPHAQGGTPRSGRPDDPRGDCLSEAKDIDVEGISPLTAYVNNVIQEGRVGLLEGTSGIPLMLFCLKGGQEAMLLPFARFASSATAMFLYMLP